MNALATNDQPSVALRVFDSIPAWAGVQALTDRSAMPLFRPGEVAVYEDQAGMIPQHGELYVVEFGGRGDPRNLPRRPADADPAPSLRRAGGPFPLSRRLRALVLPHLCGAVSLGRRALCGQPPDGSQSSWPRRRHLRPQREGLTMTTRRQMLSAAIVAPIAACVGPVPAQASAPSSYDPIPEYYAAARAYDEFDAASVQRHQDARNTLYDWVPDNAHDMLRKVVAILDEQFTPPETSLSLLIQQVDILVIDAV